MVHIRPLKQKVYYQYKNAYLDKASITCGIPQGSILGSVPFLIYIKNILKTVDKELLLYADDTYLVFLHKDIKVIEEHLNQGFSTLFDWFIDKLSVHFGEEKNKIHSVFSKT